MNIRISIRRFLHPFLLHGKIRYWFGYLRYVFFVKVQKNLKTIDSEFAIDKTISHNLSAFEHIHVDFAMNRMEHLIHAILAVEYLPKDSRILIIGPRTENDLLIFKGNGYTNVIGLDLISYSPHIKLGDMHNLPFEDSYFDVVVSAWCFTYSSNPKKAISETIRVLKNEGVFGIGFDYWPYSQDVADRIFGRSDELIKVKLNRVQSTKDILKFIGKSLGNVFFEYDAPRKLKTLNSIADLSKKGAFLEMLVCSIKK